MHCKEGHQMNWEGVKHLAREPNADDMMMGVFTPPSFVLDSKSTSIGLRALQGFGLCKEVKKHRGWELGGG